MPIGLKIDADAVFARILREGMDVLLTRGEAAALIASRVRGKHDSDRSARNRIGMELDRARERGGAAPNGGLACTADGRYTADEIAYWLTVHYPGVFDDLPCRPREFTLSITDGFIAPDAAQEEGTPGDLAGCQALVQQLREQLVRERAEHARIEAERKRKLQENFKRE